MPLPDERPRASVANLIGRFEQQTKRTSIVGTPPLVPQSTGGSSKWPPVQAGSPPKASLKHLSAASTPVTSPNSSKIVLPEEKLVDPVPEKKETTPEREEPPVSERQPSPPPKEATPPPETPPTPPPEPAPKKKEAKPPTAEPTPARKPAVPKTPTPAKPSPSTPARAKTPSGLPRAKTPSTATPTRAKTPSAATPVRSKTPSAPSAFKSPSAPRPASRTSSSRSSTTPRAPATPRTSSAHSTPARTALSPTPRTSSSGLYAPTAASLAKARNAPEPGPPKEHKKVVLSNRLTQPTAASAGKAREEPAVKPATRPGMKVGTLTGRGGRPTSGAIRTSPSASKSPRASIDRGSVGHGVRSPVLSGTPTPEPQRDDSTPEPSGMKSPEINIEPETPVEHEPEASQKPDDLEDMVNLLQASSRPVSMISIPDESSINDIPDEE